MQLSLYLITFIFELSWSRNKIMNEYLIQVSNLTPMSYATMKKDYYKM